MGSESEGSRKILISSTLGFTFETYDYYLYGRISPIIAVLFFTSSNILISILDTFFGYMIGFLFRPVGALIFGHFGDKYGRKRAMVISMIIGGISMLSIGFLPTYIEIGIMAPVLLIALRALQGISFGGEWGGSVTMVSESVKKRKGLYLVLVQSGQVWGAALDFAVFVLTYTILGPDAFFAWGWRISFFIGFFIAIIALYIRTKIYDVYEHFKEKMKVPSKFLFKNYWKELLLFVVLFSAFSALNNTTTSFSISYLNKIRGVFGFENIPFFTVSVMMIVVSIITGVISPLIGQALDKYGARKVWIISLIFIIFFSYPYYYFLLHGDIYTLIIIQTIAYTLYMVGFTDLAYSATSKFPRNVRYTGSSLSYQISGGIVGGITPFISSALIYYFNNPTVPFVWFLVLSVTALIFVVSKFGKDIFLD